MDLTGPLIPVFQVVKGHYVTLLTKAKGRIIIINNNLGLQLSQVWHPTRNRDLIAQERRANGMSSSMTRYSPIQNETLWVQ